MDGWQNWKCRCLDCFRHYFSSTEITDARLLMTQGELQVVFCDSKLSLDVSELLLPAWRYQSCGEELIAHFSFLCKALPLDPFLSFSQNNQTCRIFKHFVPAKWKGDGQVLECTKTYSLPQPSGFLCVLDSATSWGDTSCWDVETAVTETLGEHTWN